ncbi:hypothetical protein [Rhizobium sp. Pop5]|uniref:hypothetical protein n=1 Tax=Rhizobium sp. Pop5 TaxID=1223565 RepID=UPI000FFB96FE|nr:hypothetical protein [Rhizobium sp. Pop5]
MITKREVLQIGGISAAMLLLARQTQAQEGQIQATIQLTPEQAGALHSRYVTAQRQATPDRQPFNMDNLIRLIDQLMERGVINQDQRKLLVQLIEMAFSAKSRAELQERVEEVIGSAQGLLTEVTAYIVEIYRSSIRTAAELLADVDWPTVQKVIVQDFAGASAGAGIGGAFGTQGAIIGIIFCGAVQSGFAFASAGTA